jgi:hypothetical protein
MMRQRIHKRPECPSCLVSAAHSATEERSHNACPAQIRLNLFLGKGVNPLFKSGFLKHIDEVLRKLLGGPYCLMLLAPLPEDLKPFLNQLVPLLYGGILVEKLIDLGRVDTFLQATQTGMRPPQDNRPVVFR